MKMLWNILRILSGAVFIFSGFVKATDPLGSTYKITDYLTEFGWSFLTGLSLPGAVFLSLCEWTIGLCLLTKIRIKEASALFLLFMAGFTGLTLYIALTNPVSDCGCFGDALILSNWETFAKNIVLLFFALFIFLNRDKFAPERPGKKSWLWVILFALAGLGLSVYSLRHLPLIDFRPYRVGTDIEKSMEIPEGELPDEFETIFYYEKDGVTKAFSEEDYPWNDTTWIWKKTENKLVKQGYTPPIHDFSMIDEKGIDHVEELMADQGFSFLVVSWDLTQFSPKSADKIKKLASFCNQNGHSFYFLTGSSQKQVEEFKSLQSFDIPIFFTDKIQLKTMIRANPGIVLIEDGVIIKKWNFRDFPEPENIL